MTGEQMTVNVTKTITYAQFGVGEVVPLKDGTMQITFVTPDGVVHVWPIREEAAKELGSKLLAPRVALPANGHQSV